MTVDFKTCPKIYLEATGGENESPAGADDVHHDQKQGVFAGTAVGAEQHQVAHAGGNEGAGEHRRQLQRTFEVQLRNNDAGRAVGDQTDKRRAQDGERLIAAQELLDRGLAKGLEDCVTRKMNTDTCTVCEIALRMIDRRGAPSWE